MTNEEAALGVLERWLSGGSMRYVEYIAGDRNTAGLMAWRVTVADCITFSGTGSTLAAAIVRAIEAAQG